MRADSCIKGAILSKGENTMSVVGFMVWILMAMACWGPKHWWPGLTLAIALGVWNFIATSANYAELRMEPSGPILAARVITPLFMFAFLRGVRWAVRKLQKRGNVAE